jgi:formylglycine-generating enzyme required for sulfatase activity
VFFGRTRARNELRELLARQVEHGTAFVLVFGASGSGKSSLVKAGLLPDLSLPGMIGRVGLVCRAILRPSDSTASPLEALAGAMCSPAALPELADMGYSPDRLCALFQKAPEEVCVPIHQGLIRETRKARLSEAGEARLAVVVDQFEEMFTMPGFTSASREAFVTALAALAKSGLVWVIATMRSDFFERLETLPLLASLCAEGRFLLLPPDETEIGQIIRQPAYEAGLRFERDGAGGATLDEIIRQAAVKDRSVLPLLSFLLHELWQRRTEHNVLTIAAYRELGGLEGAIGHRAEQVFLAQPEGGRKELIPLLRALVTVRGVTATSRAVPLSYFSDRTPRRNLIDAFLHPTSRLLVVDGDFGPPQLRLAHEALLTHWQRVRDQVASDARDLELRGRLEHEAESWVRAPRREKPDRVLAPGFPLVEAVALKGRWGDELPAEIQAFISASQQEAHRRRRRRILTLTTALMAIPITAGVGWAGLVWWGVRSVEAEMRFVEIPAGCFEMGSPETEAERSPDEGPVHRVCLQGFALGAFEVTQGEWRRVMLHNPHPSQYEGDSHPVENVDWNEAKLFVWLMSVFGLGDYRLPSEAEWEYSARAGTRTARYWGERAEDGCAYENMSDQSLRAGLAGAVIHGCDDNEPTTMQEGAFKPNPWGLYDMLGNVAEWVEDCYTADYSQARTDGRPMIVEPCPARVIRGGSWLKFPKNLRAANRVSGSPDFRSYTIGLRVARTSTFP